ncbi:MAG: hypothetical protein HYW24_04650 [Candidatus Aenigmarchaeota archaeon]|nr:hypothetical protein [Candidatus Aenigmarchaeota archaeon]
MKLSILSILLAVSIFAFLKYNISFDDKKTPSTFGVYLDAISYEKGYRFETCSFYASTFTNETNGNFFFGCKLNTNGPELPFGYIATFPFNLKDVSGVCKKNFNPRITEGRLSEIIEFPATCQNSTVFIDDDKPYILVAAFEDYQSEFYQFVLESDSVLYRISPDILRFKTFVTTNELPIIANYCKELGFELGCVNLALPNELKFIIKIPRDKYEIDPDRLYPQPTSITDNGRDGYEISWSTKGATLFQADFIDLEKQREKNIVNYLSSGMFGVVMGILIGQWFTLRKEDTFKEVKSQDKK